MVSRPHPLLVSRSNHAERPTIPADERARTFSGTLSVRRHELPCGKNLTVGSEFTMLALAIIMTIVAAALFAMGLGLAGFVILTKIREYRQGANADTRSGDNPVLP